MKLLSHIIGGYLVVSLTGCILCKTGGGPVSREEALRIAGCDFAPATEKQKTAFVKLDQAESWSKETQLTSTSDNGFGPRVMAKYKSDLSIGKIFKAGWVPSRIYLMEHSPKEGSEIFCQEQVTFIPGYPIIWPIWAQWSDMYLQSTGEQVGKSRFFGLGLGGFIACNVKFINPVTLDIQKGQMPEQYTVFKGWFLATGVVGGGCKNHRYYGQLLWIAFPLGEAN